MTKLLSKCPLAKCPLAKCPDIVGHTYGWGNIGLKSRLYQWNIQETYEIREFNPTARDLQMDKNTFVEV